MKKHYYGIKVKFHPPTEHRDTRISASSCWWYNNDKKPRVWRNRNYVLRPDDDAIALASEYMRKIVLPERARLLGEHAINESAEVAGIVECHQDTFIVLFNIIAKGGAA